MVRIQLAKGDLSKEIDIGNAGHDEIGSTLRSIDNTIKKLKRFPDERGIVMHIMKSTDEEFKGFGEVYCSSIYPGP